MKFSITAMTALLSASVFASPLEARQDGAVSMAAAVPQWTFTNVKRVCNSADTSCAWSFGIQTNQGNPAVPCSFTVTGSPASRTDSTGNICGGFTVSTGWSGQFGANKGFTTLATVQRAKKLISYPAYTDAELAGGKVVKPNRSYPVQKVPS